jgi:hypothetical protein
MSFYKALFHDESTPIHCTQDSRLVVWNANADGSLTQNAAPVAFGPPQGYSATYQGYHHHLGAPCMPVHAPFYGHPIQIGQTPQYLQLSAQGPILQLPPQQHHQQEMLSSCAAAPGQAVIAPSGQHRMVPGSTQQAACIPVQFSSDQEHTHQRLHQAYMDVLNHASSTTTTSTNGEPNVSTNQQGPAYLVVKPHGPLTSDPLVTSPSAHGVCPTLAAPVDAILPTTSRMVAASDNQPSSGKTVFSPANSASPMSKNCFRDVGPAPMFIIQPDTPKYQLKGRQSTFADDDQPTFGAVPIVMLSSDKDAASSAPPHRGQAEPPAGDPPCCSEVAPEVPDFLSGFEKVAARARETREEPSSQFQWIVDGFDVSVDVSATTPMNTVHEEAYSPYFTSRSFDDLHCHLGKGLSSPQANDFDLNSADSYALFAQQSAHAVSQHSAYARREQNGDELPQLSLPSVVSNQATLSQNYAAAVSKFVQPHSGFINAANLLAHAQAVKYSRVDMMAFSTTNGHDDEEGIGQPTYSVQEHRNTVSVSEQSHSDRWTEEGGSTRGSENNTISDHASNDSDSTADEGPRNKKQRLTDESASN